MSGRGRSNPRLTLQNVPTKPIAPAPGSNTQVQSQFMYMFERLSEPLYFGPRGADNAYFMIDPSGIDENTRKTAEMIRQGLQQASVISSTSFAVKMPRTMPNLLSIGSACRRNELFSYFLPSHKQAANELVDILLSQQTRDDFLSMCCACRDNSMVNAQLWMHAVVSATLKRPDMRGIQVPAIWEVMPDLFINTPIRKLAQAQASIPMQGRVVLKVNGHNLKATTQREGRAEATAHEVTIDASFTGRNENPENKLWYFREDLGVASHHWHWHVVFTGTSPMQGPGSRDRKGELFYYMHHSMIARYDSERLCNGLARVRILDIATAPVVEEGYFPKLTSENSGQIWGGRQEHTLLRGVARTDGDREFRVDIEDVRKWKDRLLDAIDTGFVFGRDGKRIQLTPEKGIDILGGLIENGGMTSVNDKFYGNMHNMGHVIIAYAHDPEKRHNENIGPMGDEATAMKDPVFYRWHKFIDDLFDKYKQTLTPYTKEELVWDGIRVTEVSVNTPNRVSNLLITNWMESDIDLTRGLDLRRSTKMNQGPVWARLTHLNHESFNYNITIQNDLRKVVPATVRIFMAPRFNEHGQRFPFAHQRSLFFEMDKISTELRPGENKLVRSSEESTVTIPWESSFRDLEKLMKDGMYKSQDAICGCGWPQHLLLPRGNSGGVFFDLFVMVTDGAKDAVPRRNNNRPGCKESLSFCGALDELYPDSKPMGFPFDRVSRAVPQAGTNMAVAAQDLDGFIPKDANIMSIQIKILHENTVSLRGNGAPSTMAVLEPSNATARRIIFPQQEQTQIIPESPPQSPGRQSPPPRSRGRPTNNRRRYPSAERGVEDYVYDSSPERFNF